MELDMKKCMECNKDFPRDFSGSEYCPICRIPHVKEIAKTCPQCCHICRWIADCPEYTEEMAEKSRKKYSVIKTGKRENVK